MNSSLRTTIRLFPDTLKKWWDKDPFRQSAVIAYYAVFSLPGLLVLFSTLASHVLGGDGAADGLHGEISAAMGNDTADLVRDMIEKASQRTDSLWASLVGIGTVLVGATGVFVQLQKSFNIIWEVKATPAKSGLWTFIRSRLFSFGLILSTAFLLLVSLVLTSLLAAMSKWVETHWPDYVMFLFRFADSLVSLAVISVLFALMFRFLPDAKVKWRHVWIGSWLTSLLFVLGKAVLGFYFGKAEPGSSYGAGGSVILILLWVSYSSLIVFFGAEFTRAYADLGQGTVPAGKNAVKAPGRKT